MTFALDELFLIPTIRIDQQVCVICTSLVHFIFHVEVNVSVLKLIELFRIVYNINATG